MHPHPDIARMRSHEYSPLARSTIDSENRIHQVHEKTGPVPVPGGGADPSYSSNDTTPKREDKPPLLISTNPPTTTTALPHLDDHPLSATSSTHPLYSSSLDTTDSDQSHTLASPNLLHAAQDEDEHSALTSQSLNHDGTPKRPMNAFMIFARRRRPQVSAANQSMRTGEISKILSREWSTMPMRDKQFYLDQAKKLKDNFSNRYPDYVYKRRPNNSRKRRRANSLDSLNTGVRPGEDNDSGEGEHPSPGHDSGSSIHSRGLGSPDQLISPATHIDVSYGGWPNRSVHHPHIGPPHDSLAMDIHHPTGLPYPDRYNHLAWPSLSPLGSKPPSQHTLHHRGSWGGHPPLAPISADDPRPDEMAIEPSPSWGGPVPPMIPKLDSIKLESSSAPPSSTTEGWLMPMSADPASGPFHHSQPVAVNRYDVYHPLPPTMTSRPWSASGSSGESDTNTHSGSIHSAHHSFDPTMVTSGGPGPGPGPGPTGEYFPSPTSANSSLFFSQPPPLHSGASSTPHDSVGTQTASSAPAGPEGPMHPQDISGNCHPNLYEDEPPYGLPGSHTQSPPPSFGSSYLPHPRTPSVYEMSSRNSLRRESAGLEPPFGMH